MADIKKSLTEIISGIILAGSLYAGVNAQTKELTTVDLLTATSAVDCKNAIVEIEGDNNVSISNKEQLTKDCLQYLKDNLKKDDNTYGTVQKGNFVVEIQPTEGTGRLYVRQIENNLKKSQPNKNAIDVGGMNWDGKKPEETRGVKFSIVSGDKLNPDQKDALMPPPVLVSTSPPAISSDSAPVQEASAPVALSTATAAPNADYDKDSQDMKYWISSGRNLGNKKFWNPRTKKFCGKWDGKLTDSSQIGDYAKLCNETLPSLAKKKQEKLPAEPLANVAVSTMPVAVDLAQYRLSLASLLDLVDENNISYRNCKKANRLADSNISKLESLMASSNTARGIAIDTTTVASMKGYVEQFKLQKSTPIAGCLAKGDAEWEAMKDKMGFGVGFGVAGIKAEGINLPLAFMPFGELEYGNWGLRAGVSVNGLEGKREARTDIPSSRNGMGVTNRGYNNLTTHVQDAKAAEITAGYNLGGLLENLRGLIVRGGVKMLNYTTFQDKLVHEEASRLGFPTIVNNQLVTYPSKNVSKTDGVAGLEYAFKNGLNASVSFSDNYVSGGIGIKFGGHYGSKSSSPGRSPKARARDYNPFGLDNFPKKEPRSLK